MNLTADDEFELAQLISAGNFCEFKGHRWNYIVAKFGGLTEGNPDKCQKLLNLMRDAFNCEGETARRIQNMYLELMLYVSDYMTIDEKDNT